MRSASAARFRRARAAEPGFLVSGSAKTASAAFAAVAERAPDLALWTQHWLQRAPCLRLQGYGAPQMVVPATGLLQGDPVSGHLFSVTLAAPLDMVHAQLTRGDAAAETAAYLDDVVLAATPRTLAAATPRRHWRRGAW